MQFILKFTKPLSCHEVLALNHQINRDLGTTASFNLPTAQEIFTEVEVKIRPCHKAIERLHKIARAKKFTIADKL